MIWVNVFSILAIDNKLSLVIEISKYLSKNAIAALYDEAVASNNKLDSSLRVSQIYFTYDKIQADTAIKVSRQYLLKKLENKEVSLIKVDEIKENEDIKVNPLILNDVIEIFKEVLLKDEVKENSNFFFDLEGTSLDYFSLISQLNQKFNVEITFKEENNFHTPIDLAIEIERLLEL